MNFKERKQLRIEKHKQMLADKAFNRIPSVYVLTLDIGSYEDHRTLVVCASLFKKVCLDYIPEAKKIDPNDFNFYRLEEFKGSTLVTYTYYNQEGVDINYGLNDENVGKYAIKSFVAATAALKNGMTTKVLFEQLKDIRKTVSIPLIIMGYFNPMMQYGIEAFCKEFAEIGIDGLIIPDLPLKEYNEKYKAIFEKYGLINVFLITPQTSDERIRFIDKISDGFIYMVSSASVTGSQSGFGSTQEDYFKRIANMNLKNPQIIGFGISNKTTFQQATKHQKGAIIGSSFIQFISNAGEKGTMKFIKQ